MTTRWMAGVARRLAPPPAGSDRDLLARFADAQDAGAFAALVERHGAAVYGVCRARLGHTADAEDAFQVVFYVLARDARRVRDRESVAGWLARVAHLTALKVRRHHARHPAGELSADVPGATPPDGVALREERAIVAEELAALPDKFRAVLLLCAVEGRSNTEAAEALGCPRGTVDSRLAAAKAKLRSRLVRRGVGLAALAGFEAALPTLGADAAGWPKLADGFWLTAIQYGAGGAPATTLTLLADGVIPTMTTTTKLAATLLLAGGLLTTAGVGLTQGTGDGPPQAAKAEKGAKATPPKKADAPPKQAEETSKPADTPAAVAPLTESQARAQLTKVVTGLPEVVTLAELAAWIHKEYGVIVRVDQAAYSRLAPLAPDFLIYEHKLKFPVTTGMSVADLLTDAVTQLTNESGRIGYRVRDGVVLIGPAYLAPVMPGRTNSEGNELLIDSKRLAAQVLGEPVSLSVEDKSIKEVVKELRRLTGANIVVDYRGVEGGDKALLTATFDDVPLYSALEILGDMAGLAPVFRNNIYYLTSPENAEKLQKKVNEELFGADRKQLIVPAGFLTDGINYYRNPGTLKPETPQEAGLGIGGGVPGVEPAKPTPTPAGPTKK